MRKFLALVVVAAAITIVAAAPAPSPSPTPDDSVAVECKWEDPNSKAGQAFLDQTWEEAIKAANVKTNLKRPRVCGRDGAPIVTIEGRLVFLCGYYNPPDNTVLGIVDADICPDLRCNLIHEFVHALRGPGHKFHKQIMAAAGCSEDDASKK